MGFLRTFFMVLNLEVKCLEAAKIGEKAKKEKLKKEKLKLLHC
jgi:hypothetical protein